MTPKEYYSSQFVQWEMCKQLRYKYLSLRKMINGKYEIVRYLLGYNPTLLTKSIEKYGGFQQEGLKLYFDLAHWKDAPMFSFEPAQRGDQREKFNIEWQQYFNGYDFPIDIDYKNLTKAYKLAKEIKEVFDAYKLPYSLRWSGQKGYHFVIPYEYLPKNIPVLDLPDKCYRTTMWLIDRYNFPCATDDEVKKEGIDDTIYDARRVLKLAYSLDGDNVVLPLNDEQFERFTPEMVKIDKVWKSVRIFNRGLLTRTHGLTQTELFKNTKLFFMHRGLKK